MKTGKPGFLPLLILLYCINFCSISQASETLQGLHFDFNHDGIYDSVYEMHAGDKVSVDIWIAGWQEAFPGDKLFGISMNFYYDESQLKVIEGGTHYSPVEFPEETNKILEDFFKKNNLM